jgi:hypothetical protein
VGCTRDYGAQRIASSILRANRNPLYRPHSTCFAPRKTLAKNGLGAINHRINAPRQLSKPLHFRASAQDYVSRIACIGYQVEKPLKFCYFGGSEVATRHDPHHPRGSIVSALVELSNRSHLGSNNLFDRQYGAGNPQRQLGWRESISPVAHSAESYAAFAMRRVMHFTIGGALGWNDGSERQNLWFNVNTMAPLPCCNPGRGVLLRFWR